MLRLSTVSLATLQLRSLTTSWCCNTCFKIIRIFKLAILTRLFQIQFLFVSSALSRFSKNNSLIKVCGQRTCKRSNGSINQEEKRKSIGGWLKGKCNPHGSNLLVMMLHMLFFSPNSFSFFDFQVSYGGRRVLSHDSCNSPCISCHPEAHVIFSHRAFCAFSRIVSCWVIMLWQLADDKWTKQTNPKKGLRNWVEANKWRKGHKSSVSEKTILPCAGSFMRSRENWFPRS